MNWKEKMVMEMNKRETCRPSCHLFPPLLPVTYRPGVPLVRGLSPEPGLPALQAPGTIHLAVLPSEFSDLVGICVLLPAKVFY